MAYKLAVDDKVGLKIKCTTVDKSGREKEFAFVLVCDRLDQDAVNTALADGNTTTQFFEKHATDWQGQTLVLEENGTPAPFSADALRALLSISGLANVFWRAYLQQAGASAKN
jgi:hypothetical protein